MSINILKIFNIWSIRNCLVLNKRWIGVNTPPFGGIMLYKIFIKIFVLIFVFSISTYAKDNYNRDDYQYDHNKARKFFIFFYDPYSGKTFHDTDDIEIDHIVPLSLAHKMGGYLWTPQQKKTFANDTENLIRVSKTCNRSKGSKSISQWMPKNSNYHAEYLRRYHYIMTKYKLK